jgi:beta-glucosidase
MEIELDTLIAQMTLEEKVKLLAGADLWNTHPIERLGIPSIRVTDGPNGARGTEWSMSPPAVDVPVGVALAATWNTQLVGEVGKVLGDEVIVKGAHALLGPTVNIHRSPLAGRNFECYSEDPLLSGKIAAAYIRGLQSKGVAACIKHFVCNDSEFERMSMSSVVAERPLREIYLKPFEIAIQEGKPWTIMSSYNRINGVYASENTYTLLDILKGEWGFDGLVMSDWFGTYSPQVLPNGLDLEMPGPARWMKLEHAQELIAAGILSEEVIDDKIRRLLRTIQRVGGYERPGPQPETSRDLPEHHQVVLQAATEAIVLLKNEANLLPIKLDQVKKIAVIGANARWAQVMGGGSANVTPHYVVSPLEGIKNRVGQAAKVEYAIGAPMHKRMPLIELAWLTAGDGKPGLTVDLFDNENLSGLPADTQTIDRFAITWSEKMLAKVNPNVFSARLSAVFTAPETGIYTFGLMGSGKYRLHLNQKLLVDSWVAGDPSIMPWSGGESKAEIHLEAGKSYPLSIDFANTGEIFFKMLRIGCLPPLPANPVQEAVELAKGSDVVILYAGLTDEWESEGYDRADLALRGEQDELIRQVVAANPQTIVVLNTGAPVEMDWLDQVPALLQVWYGGQEAGNAAAAVLFGDANPSGKLPTTFPRRLQDTPAYINYPGENGQVLYGEGLFVGYRYYEMKDVAPSFAFGHGLSYTTFAYRNLSLPQKSLRVGDPVEVSLEVVNTGSLPGQEVVQLYVRDTECSLVRPLKELKAFAKVTLQPGEVKAVSFTLDEDAFAYYQTARKAWVVEPGSFEILVGSSSQDIRLAGTLELNPAPVKIKGAALNCSMPIRVLLADAGAREVLDECIPGFTDNPMLDMAAEMSLEQMAGMAARVLTPEILELINSKLAQL